MKREDNTASSWTPLRGVCRAWKQAVDRELQREESYSKKGICEANKSVLVPTFKRAEDFIQFEDHFDPTHLDEANPLLCRAIKICLEWDHDGEHPEGFGNIFCPIWRDFLRKYGEFVWSCEIEENLLKPRNKAQFYVGEFQQTLSLMPNLRFLQLTGTSRRPGDLEVVDKNIHNMSYYPWPGDRFLVLENLNQVRFRNVPKTVAAWFLEENAQVSKLDVMGKEALSIGTYLDRLPFLTALAFALKDKQELEQLIRWQGRCQSVEYLWLNARKSKDVTWKKLFHVLETCFSHRLTYLWLALPPPKDVTTTFSLKLPKLKKLKLRVMAGQPLQFLMGMKDTLEQLSLEIMEAYEDLESGENEEEKVVQMTDNHEDFRLFEVWKQPHKSNIWANFSKLRLGETGLARGGPRYSGTRSEWKEWEKERSGQLKLKSD